MDSARRPLLRLVDRGLRVLAWQGRARSQSSGSLTPSEDAFFDYCKTRDAPCVSWTHALRSSLQLDRHAAPTWTDRASPRSPDKCQPPDTKILPRYSRPSFGQDHCYLGRAASVNDTLGLPGTRLPISVESSSSLNSQPKRSDPVTCHSVLLMRPFSSSVRGLPHEGRKKQGCQSPVPGSIMKAPTSAQGQDAKEKQRPEPDTSLTASARGQGSEQRHPSIALKRRTQRHLHTCLERVRLLKARGEDTLPSVDDVVRQIQQQWSILTGSQSKSMRASISVVDVVEVLKLTRSPLLAQGLLHWAHHQMNITIDAKLATVYIRALAKVKDLQALDGLEDTMKLLGGFLDEIAFCRLMQAYWTLGKEDIALSVPRRMLEAGVPMTAYSYGTLMAILSKAGRLRPSMSLFEEVLKRGTQVNGYMCSIYLDACRRLREFRAGERAYKLMLEQGVALSSSTHNAMLAIYRDTRQVAKAKELFERWKGIGDERMHTTHLDILAKLGSCDEGEGFFQDMVKAGLANDSTWSAMIHMYGTRTSPMHAAACFLRMLDCGQAPGIYSCKALLNCLLVAKKYGEADSLLQSMAARGLKPDLLDVACILDNSTQLSPEEAHLPLHLLTHLDSRIPTLVKLLLNFMLESSTAPDNALQSSSQGVSSVSAGRQQGEVLDVLNSVLDEREKSRVGHLDTEQGLTHGLTSFFDWAGNRKAALLVLKNSVRRRTFHTLLSADLHRWLIEGVLPEASHPESFKVDLHESSPGAGIVVLDWVFTGLLKHFLHAKQLPARLVIVTGWGKGRPSANDAEAIPMKKMVVKVLLDQNIYSAVEEKGWYWLTAETNVSAVTNMGRRENDRPEC